MSKLSVCMATRNGGRFIAQQLESILRQIGPLDELVISDDSSTDDTIGIIKGFADQRIRLSEGNTFFNPVFNFENAIRISSGDVIALADQDDIWLDGKVELIKAAMASNSERCYMLIMNGQIVDESGALLGRTVFDQTGATNGVLRNLFDSGYVGCCMAFKRHLLEFALPFPATLPMHDWWLGLLNEACGCVRFDPTITLHYRRHSATVTELPKRVRSLGQIKCRMLMTWHLLLRLLKLSCTNRKA